MKVFKQEVLIHVCQYIHLLITGISQLIQMFLNLEVLNLSFLFTKQMDLLCTSVFQKKDNTVNFCFYLFIVNFCYC